MSWRRGVSRWASFIVALGWAGPLVAATPASSGPRAASFDFNYTVSGDPAARPLQVFDDGAGRTYFQFRSQERIPVILAGTDQEMVLPSAEGPYQVVVGRAWQYTLVAGRSKAMVRHAGLVAGGSVTPSTPEGAAVLAGPPVYRPSDRTASSYATPTRGDVIEWVEPMQAGEDRIGFMRHSTVLQPASKEFIRALAQRFGRRASVQIGLPHGASASRLDRARLDALHAALVEAGLNPRRLSSSDKGFAGPPHAGELRVRWEGSAGLHAPDAPVRPPVVPRAEQPVPSGRPVRGNFDVLASDKTLAVSLSRWALASGHQFKWDAALDAPVTREVTLDADGFPEAAAQVVRQLQAAGHPVRLERDGAMAYRVSIAASHR